MPVHVKVSEVMSTNMFTVSYDETLKKADEIIHNEHVKYVPVLESGKFVGMITERKIMEYSLRQIYDFDSNLGDLGFNKISDYEQVIENHQHVIYPEDSLPKGIKLMSKYNLEYLPVVDWDNNFKGIISTKEIMLYLNKLLHEETAVNN